jgi:hypothetical protein
LEPLAEIGSGGEDVVMMPVDDGSAPPPLAGECDVAMSVAPESSTAVTAASIEGAADTSTSRYLDFPGIGIIDLDAIKLPSNDREILEAVTERVFADPPLLDAIVSDPPVPRQDGDAGGSAPSAAPEVAERVLGESTAGTELAAIERPPTSFGESTDAPLQQPVEAAMAAPTLSVVGAIEGVIGGAGPSSSQHAAAAMEEVPGPCHRPSGARRPRGRDKSCLPPRVRRP